MFVESILALVSNKPFAAEAKNRAAERECLMENRIIFFIAHYGLQNRTALSEVLFGSF